MDYLYQWFEHENLKNEQVRRQTSIRKRKVTRSLGRASGKFKEVAMRRMMAEVPKADVIITNPTHFAVALVMKWILWMHRV